MQKVADNIEINAPVDQVFNYVADPNHSPEWIPGMVEVSNIKGTGKDVTYDWVYKMVGIKFKGTSKRTRFQKNEGFDLQSSGAIKSNWKYSFEDKGSKTRLSVAIEYEVPSKVGAKIAAKMLQRQHQHELEQGLQIVKDLIEYQYTKSAAE
jgi:uncharacterized membrane protein